MKVLIIDFTKNHYDFIISLAKKNFLEGNKIEVLTNESCKVSLLKEIQLNYNFFNTNKIIVIEDRISEKKMLDKFFLKGYDKIIFSSITFERKMMYYFIASLNKNIRYDVAIHNVNSWFNFGKFNFKNFLRFVIKKVIIKKCDKLIVLNENIKKYLKEKTEKEIVVQPFKIPTEKGIAENSNNNIVKILVPGTVDENKRDYEFVLETFRKVQSKVKCKLQLILLGKMTSEKIQKKVAKLIREEENSIVYFNNYIDQEEYDKYIKSCDLIFSPTKKEYNFGTSSLEIYGLTKASGAEFDAIKYNKKLLINDFYKKDSLTKDLIINYKDKESAIKSLEREIKLIMR